jgi:hypothetical protein
MIPRRASLALLLAACAFAAVLAGPAQARKSYDCPKRAGTLAVKPLGRVWHQAGSVYACTTVYGRAPKLRRLGPWKAGTRVAFDGVNVVWTVPLARDGVRSDRAWAASAEDGRRWLSGRRLLPAGEARVRRVLGTDQGAAWVTTDGVVVLALRWPQSDPEAVGALPAAPQADRGLVVVGPFAAADHAALAASATLEELEGDGDECGGVNPYKLTVQPDPGADRVGVTWWGGWERPFCG